MQTALYPIFDVRPSTFSKNVDFIFDVFGEGLVKDPKNRCHRRFLGLRDPSIMYIQQVADQAHPDQLVVVKSLDIIVTSALAQPHVDVGDRSWSVVHLVVHKLPFAEDLCRRPQQQTFGIGTFSFRFGWLDVLVRRWGRRRHRIASGEFVPSRLQPDLGLRLGAADFGRSLRGWGHCVP